jgi:hypothetical protein
MPAAADVYAFGCLAFEVLTGRLLFETASVAELQSAHLSHDGSTPAINELARHGKLGQLAQTIAQTIRRDPRKRPPISAVRTDLADLAPLIKNIIWPLGGSEADTVPRLTLPIPLVVRKT